jgi:chloramphenicol 3-O phosphotransferase
MPRQAAPGRTRVTGLSMPGRIIFVNGASSSGKTTLCRALQAKLDEPFWHYSIDHFRGAGVLPMKRIDSGEFPWAGMRAAFFEGFHRCLPALAEAGNNLMVEHIVESEAWMSRLVQLLETIDVFFVGLHCPLPELERRELRRGDRGVGEARQDHFVVHTFGTYDFEVDSTQPLAGNADAVLAAWRSRTRPSAFERRLAAMRLPGRISTQEGVV